MGAYVCQKKKKVNLIFVLYGCFFCSQHQCKMYSLAGHSFLLYLHGWGYWDVHRLNGFMAVWVGDLDCGDGFLFAWGFSWVQ